VCGGGVSDLSSMAGNGSFYEGCDVQSCKRSATF
jgi:hypothetical protein